MVYHHASACISSALPSISRQGEYIISRRLYFSFAMMISSPMGWWYAIPCGIDDIQGFALILLSCHFTSKHIKQNWCGLLFLFPQTFVGSNLSDTSLTAIVRYANWLRICYSSVRIRRMTQDTARGGMHDVTGSSPVRGAIFGGQFDNSSRKSLFHKDFFVF